MAVTINELTSKYGLSTAQAIRVVAVIGILEKRQGSSASASITDPGYIVGDLALQSISATNNDVLSDLAFLKANSWLTTRNLHD